MPSLEEVVSGVCAYICVGLLFFGIYIFSESERISVDFVLRLNDTGNISIAF